MKRVIVQFSIVFCSVIVFHFAQATVSAQQPTPTPPDIVYKLRGFACEELRGGANCTPVSETTNANLSRSIVDSESRRESTLNVTVLPTDNSNILQATMGSRLQHLQAGGPAFTTSTIAYLDVVVYVKDSPSNIYTIVIDNSPSNNQHTRPPDKRWIWMSLQYSKC